MDKAEREMNSRVLSQLRVIGYGWVYRRRIVKCLIDAGLVFRKRITYRSQEFRTNPHYSGISIEVRDKAHEALATNERLRFNYKTADRIIFDLLEAGIVLKENS